MTQDNNGSGSKMRGEERRRIDRRKAELIAMPSGRVIQSILVDVSQHGLGLVAIDNILPDTQVILKLGRQKIYLSLAWCQLNERQSGGYRYGFKAMDPRINLAEVLIAHGFLNLRVLVVDDDSDIADMLSSMLSIAGFDVETAGSGNEAAAMLDQSLFHAVLSDMTMPDGDGMVVIREAQAQSIPVAVMTGAPEACRRVPNGIAIYDKIDFSKANISEVVAAVVTRTSA